MDRFQPEPYSLLNVTRYFRQNGELPPIHEGPVNVCENCYQSCETLFPVYFAGTSNIDFQACETCKEEAEVEAAKELPAKKPVRMQGELFEREVA